MMFTRVALVAAFAAAAAVPAQAAPLPSDFRQQADALLAASYPADGPGAAVVVTQGGRVVYSAGRGLADVEAGRAIGTDTPFRLGSIAKQFTAAVVLQLVAEGRLSLDDPLSRFFPDWPAPGAGATVRQLLNHSSGLQDFSKIPGWIAANRQRAVTTAELVALMRSLPARAAPGQAWEYNNGGYVMLGAVVEQVTGKAWHEAVAERIARPLGLRTIGYAVPEAVGRAAAQGYTDGEGGRQLPLPLSHMSVAHAAGGLQGSVADMARWARALHGGRVVTAPLYREMTSPARLADGSAEPYGFGLRLRAVRGRPAFVHGGAGGGLDTDSAYIPSEDLFVAVFANSDSPATDPANLVRRLAALALGEPIPVLARAEVPIASVESLFGAYGFERGPAARFFGRDGKLYIGRGDEEREVFPAGGERFFFGPGDLAWFRLERRPDGAHVLELHGADAATPTRAVRTGPVPAAFAVAPEVLRTYAGRFQTETVALVIALGENGRLTLTQEGREPVPLRPVSDTEFRIDGTPMRIVFHPENGAVDRFTLYRGARELHGRRTGR
ncbi:MAG TPA: serine hydrolase domain-containing protein [Allosphingosinicella sp.]|jgi:CubicO group peptidase (beta-lactamase class C family)